MARSLLDLRTATGSLLAGTLAGLLAGLLLLGLLLGRAFFSAGPPFGPARDPRDMADGVPPSAELLARRLEMPVQGVARTALANTFQAARSAGRSHQAVDIMAARGTPVIAVDDGSIARLQQNGPGGNAVYQHDPQGGYCYYYAHLDAYALGLAPGQAVKRGQILGFVGSTGNASPGAPHLHFAIYEVDAGTPGCNGRPVNPYAVLR